MPKENENTPTEPKSVKQDVAKTSWKALNWFTNVIATSSAVVAVQSPINTIIMNCLRTGTPLPNNIGFLAAARHLYAGTGPSLAGSGARTAYVTTSKKGAVVEATESTALEESAMESAPSKVGKMGYVSAVAAGDVAVTQIPFTLSQIRKVTSEPFLWRSFPNLYQLSKTGLMPSYAGALVNFSGLCIVEGLYAQYLPIENKKGKHFCAGVLSGVTAGLFSYPFSYYRDFVISQAAIKNGVIHTPSFSDVSKQAMEYVRKEGFLSSLKKMGSEFRVQAPLRAGRTGLTFGILAAMGEIVGDSPLGENPPEFWCKFFAPQGKVEGQVVSTPTLTAPKDTQEQEPPSPKK